MSITFAKARDAYIHQSSVRSAHTLSAYSRAIDLFMEFLGDRQPGLPLHKHMQAAPDDLPLNLLTADDEPILQQFAVWLSSSDSDSKRPYARSTIELRLAGVQRWFEFMHSKKWIPDGFSLERAVTLLKKYFQTDVEAENEDKSVSVPDDLTPLLDYYESLKPPANIKKSPEQLHQWELSRLRNHALIQTLAETGGQVSGILSLHAADIMNRDCPVVVDIKGKNEHHYQIALSDSVPAINQYLNHRAVPEEKASTVPLFVSHDAHYDGKRMSRVIAWRIIQRAAKGVGLPRISPHDFRHWRAQQLLKEGLSLEDVKNRLGHRSVHTVRAYYGHILDEDE